MTANIGCCSLVLCFALANCVHAWQPEAPPQRAIAATIDGEPVYESEVERELELAYGKRPVAEQELPEQRRPALEQVIDRHLVLAYLTATGQGASEQDVDFSLAQYEKALKAQNLTLDAHLKQVNLDADDLRRSLAWKLSWQRYLAKHLTEANLEKYFERRKPEFDGTQLRVAHMLLKVPADAEQTARDAAIERARGLKQQIAAGAFTFAEAAKKHSEAPTAKAGGDIGWIERHQPMPEPFSAAAYALAPGQVSDPVITPFGIHLITVLETKPGQKTWREVEPDLRAAVTLYLFRWIADKQRVEATIAYETDGTN